MKKGIIIFDLVVGLLDLIACIINIALGKFLMGICMGILSICMFFYMIILYKIELED